MKQILNYFFSAYFYQGWFYEYSLSMQMVEEFRSNESTQARIELVKALESLLVRDELSNEIAYEFGGFLNPASEGVTIVEWIENALAVLKRLSRGSRG